MKCGQSLFLSSVVLGLTWLPIWIYQQPHVTACDSRKAHPALNSLLFSDTTQGVHSTPNSFNENRTSSLPHPFKDISTSSKNDSNSLPRSPPSSTSPPQSSPELTPSTARLHAPLPNPVRPSQHLQSPVRSPRVLSTGSRIGHAPKSICARGSLPSSDCCHRCE
jgi:hypothetical protein